MFTPKVILNQETIFQHIYNFRNISLKKSPQEFLTRDDKFFYNTKIVENLKKNKSKKCINKQKIKSNTQKPNAMNYVHRDPAIEKWKEEAGGQNFTCAMWVKP